MKELQVLQFLNEQHDIKAEMALQLKAEITHSLGQLQAAEPVFQRKVLFKIKKEIISQIDELNIADATKSYFLHQLSNAHSADELSDLIQNING